MDSKSRQQALDDIDAEDLAKIKAYQASTSGSLAIDDEWLILAEIAQRWGWQAFLDVKNDARDEDGNLIIETAELMTLIEASRRLDYRQMYSDAQTSFIGSASANTKKPANTFKSLTNSLIKKMKADK